MAYVALIVVVLLCVCVVMIMIHAQELATSQTLDVEQREKKIKKWASLSIFLLGMLIASLMGMSP